MLFLYSRLHFFCYSYPLLLWFFQISDRMTFSDAICIWICFRHNIISWATNISVKWMFLATVISNIQSIASFQCKFAFCYSALFWSLNVSQWETNIVICRNLLFRWTILRWLMLRFSTFKQYAVTVPIWILCKSLTYYRFSFIPAPIKIFVW